MNGGHGRPSSLSLHDSAGRRKYLTDDERQKLLRVASDALPRAQWTFLLTLAHSGCRISEALAVRTVHVDLDEQRLAVASLKKRRKGVFRLVPMPPEVLQALNLVHGVRERARAGESERLWPWSRVTAWRVVSQAMGSAGISGPHATPKGLRHGFGVQAVRNGVPLNLLQRWLGHASLTTTAIYCDAQGDEELQLARRMWRSDVNFQRDGAE